MAEVYACFLCITRRIGFVVLTQSSIYLDLMDTERNDPWPEYLLELIYILN